ncbi:hypothetical protein IAR55_002101 [Kwoniella newhampshirensis]|uniref:Malate dehydrogenase n=1 Tax=Kwoniella newhampshirensis TaxID=1651941 RepID=A0AAW0YTM6_9TREE
MLDRSLVALLFLLPATLSLPFTSRSDSSTLSFLSSAPFQSLIGLDDQTTHCSVDGLTVPLSGVPGLSVPGGQKLSTITVGRGVQNYTCTSGTYVTAGAVANLFDLSCLFSGSKGRLDPTAISSLLSKMAYSAIPYPLTGDLSVVIHHFFVDTPGKVASVNDPSRPSLNVPWLQLAGIDGQGTLAKSVYRLDTVGGQPPDSCDKEGQDLSVQYAAMYYLTK